MKLLAVGDIHAKAWIIDSVESLVSEYDKVVFIGDYVDDWDSNPEDSMKVLKKLKHLQDINSEDKIDCLIGNHDFAYIHGMKSKNSGYSRILQLILNDNKEIKDWLRDLSYSSYYDGVIYSHAGLTEEFLKGSIEQDKTINLWNDHTPIWVRPFDYAYLKTKQVFGHTPHETCTELLPDIWCIDTFSTKPNGDNIGDCTALEIIDGKEFNIIKINKKVLK